MIIAFLNIRVLGLVLYLVMCVALVLLVIIFLIRGFIYFRNACKYFEDAGKEQKRIRMELSKLAEDVHLLREELKEGNRE